MLAKKMIKKKVLFICTHNSARSQMAEGYLREKYGQFFEASSAGTHPTSLNPLAVKVMSEINIDISHQRAKGLEEFRNQAFDYVITVCDSAKESCPFFPGARKYLHAGFPDPTACQASEEEKMATFRKVRDQIISWVDQEFQGIINRKIGD